jgi:hypothetical protein
VTANRTQVDELDVVLGFLALTAPTCLPAQSLQNLTYSSGTFFFGYFNEDEEQVSISKHGLP